MKAKNLPAPLGPFNRLRSTLRRLYRRLYIAIWTAEERQRIGIGIPYQDLPAGVRERLFRMFDEERQERVQSAQGVAEELVRIVARLMPAGEMVFDVPVAGGRFRVTAKYEPSA